MAFSLTFYATSRSLPALVAPVLQPHLGAVTGLLKELFPSAAAMLSNSTELGGQAAPSEAELGFDDDDSLSGVYHNNQGSFLTGTHFRPGHMPLRGTFMRSPGLDNSHPNLAQGFGVNITDMAGQTGPAGIQPSLVLHTQRPRVLICGREGSGQSHLGPAVLDALEGLPVHSVGLPSLLSDVSARRVPSPMAPGALPCESPTNALASTATPCPSIL